MIHQTRYNAPAVTTPNPAIDELTKRLDEMTPRERCLSGLRASQALVAGAQPSERSHYIRLETEWLNKLAQVSA
jgi:hypothetical protein